MLLYSRNMWNITPTVMFLEDVWHGDTYLFTGTYIFFFLDNPTYYTSELPCIYMFRLSLHILNIMYCLAFIWSCHMQHHPAKNLSLDVHTILCYSIPLQHLILFPFIHWLFSKAANNNNNNNNNLHHVKAVPLAVNLGTEPSLFNSILP